MSADDGPMLNPNLVWFGFPSLLQNGPRTSVESATDCPICLKFGRLAHDGFAELAVD